MDKLSKRFCTFFGSREKLLLPAVFCLCAFSAFSLYWQPTLRALAAAANLPGYQAAPSPEALFEPQGPDRGQVDLADTGGMPQPGELYGSVAIEGTDVACNLYYGDGSAQLHTGAGSSVYGQLPGQGGAVLIGGHTSTWFRDVESAQLGADITVETRYGEYHYKIVDMQIIEAEAFGQEQLEAAPADSLFLYTCYPFGQPLQTPYRYMIFAEYVSGPAVVNSAESGEV